ncbi:hypothetical protein [Streptomyces nanshensis]|uniref:hypothetical protein n=1 Tax=Streptomyces nanshensis TaxID=518642 RepID=UPI001FD0FE37|nr:hypothetical protein [Streptomyces nanshensis]
MTAPTPSSPDPDHSRRSSRPYHGHGGRHGGGQPGAHRPGDPGGGEHSGRPYGGAAGEGQQPYGPYGHRGGYGAQEHNGPYGQQHGSGYGPQYERHEYERHEYERHEGGEYGAHNGAYQSPPDPDALEALDERTSVRHEIRTGALWALGVLVLGAGLGLLWLWLAPRVPLVSVDGGVFLKDPEGEEAIGADGTFVLLAVAFGLVVGLFAFLRSRGGGVGIVVGVAVGALVGSVLAWRLGVWLGPNGDLAASAKAAGENKPFDGPLKLQAKGALLVWPFVALLTHLALMGVFGHRDPEPLPQPEDGRGTRHW